MAENGAIKAGYFFKQGGNLRNWKRRYFVLDSSTLKYYKKETNKKQKGTLDLTKARGVRTQKQCKVDWPKDAKEGLCFGIAIEGRTFYLYTDDSNEATVNQWMVAVQQVIEKMGNPTDNWKEDVEGKPESGAMKAVRGAAKMGAKATSKVAKNSGLDDKYTDVAVRAADLVEQQADADVHTSLKDRAKLGAIGAAGVAGATLEATADFVPNEIGQGAMTTAANVLKDQADTDPDLSLKQRLVLAGGSTLEGAADMVPIEAVGSVMQVAGGVVKDQAEADLDTNWKQRVAMGVGSAANGVGELDSLQGNAIAGTVTKIVGDVADAAVDELEDDSESEDD